MISIKGGFVFLCFILIQGIAQPSYAVISKKVPAQQLEPLLQDLSALGLPIKSLKIASSNLKNIVFFDPSNLPAVAYYDYLKSTLYLNKNLSDPKTQNVMRLEQIGWADAATVVHELWHVHVLKYLKYTGAYKKFQQRASGIYVSIPPSVRDVVYEEALGLFAESAAKAYLHVKIMLSRSTPENAQTLLKNPNFIRDYDRAFTDRVFGYYNSWGQPVFTKIALPESDKTMLLSEFFDEQITGNFVLDFPYSQDCGI